jgi:CBS domain-containing protein
MGAILGGTMRSPFTGAIFALELTHDVNALLPLFVAVTVAHGFTVLTLKRSILTEKVARRGYHLSREYAIDPLEILKVREVMRTNVVALPAGATTPVELAALLDSDRVQRVQRLFPIMQDGRFAGIVQRSEVERLLASPNGDLRMAELVIREPVIAFPDEPLRVVVQRMAETGFTRFPVVSRDDPMNLLGMISLYDLLQARVRNLEAERRRERVLPLRLARPLRQRQRDVVEVG